MAANRYVWALYETGSVVLDANGNGTIRLAPGGARERWEVTMITVTCSQPLTINVPVMTMHRTAPVPQYRIGGTYSANLDTNSTDRFVFNMNEDVYFVFSGGDVGALATVRIEGSRYVWE